MGHIAKDEHGGPRTCGHAVWRAPCGFRFHVDQQTMLAPGPTAGIPETRSDRVGDVATVKNRLWRSCVPLGSSTRENEAPAIGRVLGGGRPNKLRYMPEPSSDRVRTCSAGFSTNYPKCPFCGVPARPAVLMFG